MGKVRRILRLLPFVFVLFSGSVAHAQDSAVAQALFDDGLHAADSGDWETACQRFEESNRLDPAPGTLMNIGRCRTQLGQLAKAWESYTRAAEAFSVSDPRAEFALQEAKKLEARVPRVTLLPPPESGEAYVVFVQGTEFSQGSFEVSLPFDPGRLHIRVEAKGHEDATFQLDLEEGDRIEQQLTLGPPIPLPGQEREPTLEEPPRPPPVKRAEGVAHHRSPSPGATAAFVVAGVGAALGIAGGVWAAVERPKVNDHCDDELSCDPIGLSAAKRGQTATILGMSGAGLAILGVSLGTILLLKRERTSLALIPTPGGTVLSFQGKL